MPSYIAKTHEDWAEFLIGEGITDSVNFWSPNPRPLLNTLIGNHLFFFAKTAPDSRRRVVGWGTVREYVELSAQAAWSRFGFGNGANSLDEKLQRLNSFSSSSVASQVSSTTVIGNTIVDDVLWLDDPLEIESIGIHVAPQVVRGRSITDGEEQTLLGDYGENASDQTRQNIINQLNQEYRDSPANKRSQISHRIERNPVLVRLLKQLHPDRCQLCGDTFFWKRGRQNKYSEVHHIRQLSIGGVDAADNCLVLCANCHRKMHHGDVELQDLGQRLLVTESKQPPVYIHKNVF